MVPAGSRTDVIIDAAGFALALGFAGLVRLLGLEKPVVGGV